MLQYRKKPSRWRAAALLVLALGAALYFGRTVWLTALGDFLVRADAPEKADAAVVLAGDGYGHRVMRGVELAKEGYVNFVLITGTFGRYDSNEADLAIEFAVNRGAPRDLLVPMIRDVRSTISEAGAVDAELRQRGASKALVVTSNYHTRRARAIFRRYASSQVQYRFIAAPDEFFRPEDWWRSRDAQKIVFLEYAKLLSWWLGY